MFLSRELVGFKAKSANLNTDGTFLWLAQNILVQHLNYATTYLSSAMSITQFRGTDTTVHNHAQSSHI